MGWSKLTFVTTFLKNSVSSILLTAHLESAQAVKPFYLSKKQNARAGAGTWVMFKLLNLFWIYWIEFILNVEFMSLRWFIGLPAAPTLGQLEVGTAELKSAWGHREMGFTELQMEHYCSVWRSRCASTCRWKRDMGNDPEQVLYTAQGSQEVKIPTCDNCSQCLMGAQGQNTMSWQNIQGLKMKRMRHII